MNVDVKNAFDKIITICESVATNTFYSENSLKKLFAEDILNFIRNISTDDGNKRFDIFSSIYFEDNFLSANMNNSRNSTFLLLQKFCELDNTILASSNLKTAELLINFYRILGKSYLFSSVDKLHIDTSQFTSTIEVMKNYIDHQYSIKNSLSSYPAEQVNSVKEVVSAKKQTDESENTHEPEETLEELLDSLNSLIGLAEVKKEVSEIINLIKVKKKAEEFGKQTPPLSLHLVFSGNPGTGKTTIARLLAKIYKKIGVLSKGQFVETDRSGLVGGYVGQTAIKTKEVIDSAMGGILFVDEAYALTHGKGENDFGQEAVDTILKAMEDNRDDFIVIVAGYTELMKEFIESNPGLKSRFNQYISFEDYNPDELKAIFCLLCENQYTLSDDCEAFLKSYFEKMYNNRSDDYANGRDVRNFFEKTYRAQANRISANLDHITPEDFSTILLCDLEIAAKEKDKI